MAGQAPLDELVVANLLGELAAVTLELAAASERLTSVAIQFGKMARGWAEYASSGIVLPEPPPLTADEAAEIAATWKARYAGAGVAQPAPVAPVVPPHPRHEEDR
jgi:hypothetical protein